MLLAPLRASITETSPQDGTLQWSSPVLEGMTLGSRTHALIPGIVLTLECLDGTRVFTNRIDYYNSTASTLGIRDASADCFLVWVDNDLRFVPKELTV